MSLTAVLSAATSVADPGDGGHERKWADQTRKQRDLYTQFVISSALGLVAFFSFCVCVFKINCLFFFFSALLLIGIVGSPTEMDGVVCCTQTTTLRSISVARVTSHLSRLDTGSL